MLEEIKARHSNVPKQWEWKRCYEMYRGTHWALVNPQNPDFVVNANLVTICTEDNDFDGIPINNNALFQFIEHAPTDTAWLIAEVERLRAELNRANVALEVVLRERATLD